MTYRSNISFQYGFNVFLITDVVWVCSPPTVATANGSGNPTMIWSADKGETMLVDYQRNQTYGIHRVCITHPLR